MAILKAEIDLSDFKGREQYSNLIKMWLPTKELGDAIFSKKGYETKNPVKVLSLVANIQIKHRPLFRSIQTNTQVGVLFYIKKEDGTFGVFFVKDGITTQRPSKTDPFPGWKPPAEYPPEPEEPEVEPEEPEPPPPPRPKAKASSKPPWWEANRPPWGDRSSPPPKSTPFTTSFVPSGRISALELLGLKSSAQKDEIKKAYKQKLFKYHPDIAGNTPENHKMTVALNRAMELLTTESIMRMVFEGLIKRVKRS